MLRRFALPVVLAALLPACANDDALVLADAANDAAASAAVKQLLLGHAADLQAAALDLQAAAPTPGQNGWSEASNPAAVDAMRTAWKRADLAYRGLEGAADLYFSDLDAAIDGRYEDALAQGPDPDPFNGQGFVGLHAVERILWAGSGSIPPSVTAFESTLPGYTAASFPPSAFAAQEFHNALCERLVTDTATLKTRIAALSLDSPGAYQTAVHLVKGQLEKLQEAGAGKDQSRYAGFTLADMSANVAAAKATHEAFHAWLLSKQDGGSADDSAVATGFATLEKAYAAYAVSDGERLSPPPGWSSVDPAGTLIISDFGQLFAVVGAQVNESDDGSLLSSMGKVIQALGIAPSTAADGGTDAGTSNALPPDPT